MEVPYTHSTEIQVCHNCYASYHNGEDSIPPETDPKPWSFWDDNAEVGEYRLLDTNFEPCEACDPKGSGEGDSECETCYGSGTVDIGYTYSSHNCHGCFALPGERYSMLIEWQLIEV